MTAPADILDSGTVTFPEANTLNTPWVATEGWSQVVANYYVGTEGTMDGVALQESPDEGETILWEVAGEWNDIPGFPSTYKVIIAPGFAYVSLILSGSGGASVTYSIRGIE